MTRDGLPALAEGGDELFLDLGLDGLVAVGGSHPSQRVARGSACENGETRKRGSRSAVTAETSHLDQFTSSGPVEKVNEGPT